jgi:hypothetical protein
MGVVEKEMAEAVEEVVQVKAGEGEGGMAAEAEEKVAPCVRKQVLDVS